jgi:hypothetical protein
LCPSIFLQVYHSFVGSIPSDKEFHVFFGFSSYFFVESFLDDFTIKNVANPIIRKYPVIALFTLTLSQCLCGL